MQPAVKRSERDTPLQLRYPKWALAWAILIGLGFLVNLSYLDQVREDEQALYLFDIVLQAGLGWLLWYGITLAIGWIAHRFFQPSLVVPPAPRVTYCPNCGPSNNPYCFKECACVCHD